MQKRRTFVDRLHGKQLLLYPGTFFFANQRQTASSISFFLLLRDLRVSVVNSFLRHNNARNIAQRILQVVRAAQNVAGKKCA
jgi:hypothetical protein